MNSAVSARLLAWYDAHKRRLPWRDIKNPYATWVSETMLQQTRVETVLGYYQSFLNAFPDIASLASAPLEDVLKLWEGLGYYSRARNLHAGAVQVVREYNGQLPHNRDELIKIRGIGPYTAGAIASIAFGEPAPAVDGNVIRVVSRLRGVRDNAAAPGTRRRIEALVKELIPADRPGDFNQALMDLGSGVCVPGTPDCHLCPLRALCSAFSEGDAEDLPVLPVRTLPKTERYLVIIIINNSRVLMRQRTENMLRGLWVFPMADAALYDKPSEWALEHLGMTLHNIHSIGATRHVFTHRVWEMQLCSAFTDTKTAPSGWSYLTAQEIRSRAVPTAMRAAVKAAMDLLGPSGAGS